MTHLIENITESAQSMETSESIIEAINEIATPERTAMHIWIAPTNKELDAVVISAKLNVGIHEELFWGDEAV
jgi:hypothetical protein